MRIKLFLFLGLFLLTIWILPKEVFACESCMICRLGKDGGMRAQSADKKWFFEYLFEQKNYDRMDAADAHNLHHAGHEVHDKTSEDFHHFTLGRHVTDHFSLSAEIPYVIRRSLEVDNHAILGNKQRSEGLGDTTLLGDYCLWRSAGQSAGAVAGIKFPTGYTGEKNTLGDKFEPELQPGSGSFDYIVGGVYKVTKERFNVSGNVSYVFNTPGAYHFKFGNMFTASAAADYLLNPKWNKFQSRAGMDLVYQNEWKERQDGVKNPDSGGTRVLVGPILNVGALPQANIFASILFPAYQDLGGVHQQLDYVWTLGAKVSW